MSEFETVLAAVLPVFSIAGLGFLIRRLDWLTAEADASLLRVLINLLVPCFFLDSILGNAALREAGNILIPPLVGFGTVALGTWISFLVAGHARRATHVCLSHRHLQLWLRAAAASVVIVR